MGNIHGLQGKGALNMDKVAPVAAEVVNEYFPTLLKTIYNPEIKELIFEWVHPDDAKDFGGTASEWYQYNRAKVGGKHFNGGTASDWIMSFIDNQIGSKLGPNIRIWDEGVQETWKPIVNKFPTLWDYMLMIAKHKKTQEDKIRSLRLHYDQLLYIPKGLDPKYTDNIPDWVKDPTLPEPSGKL